jgi:hypothetical protein
MRAAVNNKSQLVIEEERTLEQQSQKRGLKSEAQKEQRARDGYEPIPPANPVAGAFGEHKSDRDTDEEVSLKKNTRRHENDQWT